jgi:hypothetical protein
MEFIEASSLTRGVSNYFADDEYRKLQTKLTSKPELGDVMPGTGGAGNSAGRIQNVARDAEAGCELSIFTSQASSKFGS